MRYMYTLETTALLLFFPNHHSFIGKGESRWKETEMKR